MISQDFLEFLGFPRIFYNFFIICSDGNGRTARLLMNQVLMAAGFPSVNIKVQVRPSSKQKLYKKKTRKRCWDFLVFFQDFLFFFQDRLEYYRVLDEASNGDILEFERFLAKQMEVTLNLYLDCILNDDHVLSAKENHQKIENFRDTIEL